MIFRLILALLPLRAAAYHVPRSADNSNPQTFEAGQLDANAVNNLIVFGNSYSALGFNPRGPLPSARNPIGNPAWPGNNLSGGENWVTYLTDTYNRSMTYTYDFAYNCATVDEHLVAPCSPEIPSISQQVQQFRTSFMTKRDVFGPGHFGGQNTVTAIWIGINDAHRSWEKPNAKGIMDAVIDRYFQLVQDLVNAGLKNIVLLGIPAIERSPQILSEPASSQALELSTYNEFNVALYQRYLRTTYPGVRLILIDMVPIFNDILNNPGALMAPDAECVGKDAGCLWSDNFHPARKMHLIIARRIAGILSPTMPWFFKN